jgi:CBS domain-containing protein
MAFINMVLGVFNLLPGFPLDGGRVLRSILWFHWKDQVRATRVASQVGSGFGLLLMIVGGIQIFGGNPVGGFWYILIGFFLRNAALGSYQQLTFKEVLGRKKVRELMTEDPISVGRDLPIERLVSDYILRQHHSVYPVVEDGQLLGAVIKENLNKLPREQWTGRPVEDLMTPLEKLTSVSPDDSAIELLKLLNLPEGRILVRSGAQLDGIVSRRDLLDYIALRSDVNVHSVQGSGRSE